MTYVTLRQRLPRGEEYPDIFIVDPTMPRTERLAILYDMIELDRTNPEIIELSRAIVAQAIRDRRSAVDDPIGHLQSLLDWQTRSVRYQEDPTDEEGWQIELFKRPMRAISDTEDDCEGKVVVYCTMAWSINYVSYPLWLEQTNSRNNHVVGCSVVPEWAAKRTPTPGTYAVEVILPPDAPPLSPRSARVWAETTLGPVKTPRGIVPGPRINEHPYDVLARFREAGVSRLGL